MAKLTDAHKAFIVNQLAAFSTPSEVAVLVKEQFEIEIGRDQVAKYHPEASEKPAKKWIAMFEKARKRFLKDTSDIAISHRAFRLKELEDMRRRAKARGNLKQAAELMEQAAKEQGDSFSNKQILHHKGKIGGDQPQDIGAATQRLTALLKKLGAKDAAPGA